ncbi:MAG: ABC transporter ATP-binding protein [Herminiimonas sp.]|uniref:ABC transporter ATP-binding protein n=1 Tax=Herminiimonas sp. TaxID=1926289 RepID=UPI002728C3BB|nr:ABC transporter ATP-binding protein [Herminiimonas sp.]MDO9420098.1 ABC transporter ATP-binding protein [Herminiimonas sp.]
MTVLLDLHVRNKSFADRTVLQDVTLQIQAGEIVSLVGKSGCGKSTLLRLIAGLDRQFSGEISLNGKKLDGITQDIGLIFQEPRLLPWLTVAENVGFNSNDKNINIRVRIENLLHEVGLSDAIDYLPKNLSGGMAQRAAIARGLFNQPRLLLLDEPFSAVDAFTRMRLQDLLTTLARQHDFAVLLVTHDIDEAAYLSDRVLTMGDGNIIDETAVTLARPRSRHAPELTQARDDILKVLEENHVV